MYANVYNYVLTYAPYINYITNLTGNVHPLIYVVHLLVQMYVHLCTPMRVYVYGPVCVCVCVFVNSMPAPYVCPLFRQDTPSTVAYQDQESIANRAHFRYPIAWITVITFPSPTFTSIPLKPD